jgi:hypothetical protein
MESVALAIHQVLFPGSEYGYAEFCAARGVTVDEEHIDHRWRNQRCDVLALWSHIHHRRNIFVTRDGNFLGSIRRTRLENMGAERICSPMEALVEVRNSRV